MAFNRIQAQKLCNASEYQLVCDSMSDAVAQLTLAQLRSKIGRARTLRDKNTDLYRRQTVATRSATGIKRGNTSEANLRTEKKARLFDETLQRFEARQAKIASAAAKLAPVSKPKPARKSPTQAATPKPPAKAAAPKKSAARRTAAKPAAQRTSR
jgi:hypothetical protein